MVIPKSSQLQTIMHSIPYSFSTIIFNHTTSAADWPSSTLTFVCYHIFDMPQLQMGPTFLGILPNCSLFPWCSPTETFSGWTSWGRKRPHRAFERLMSAYAITLT